MSKSKLPASPASPSPNPATPSLNRETPSLNPLAIFSGLSNAVRWQAVTMMANGQEISASELAAAAHRQFDISAKQLRILNKIGAVQRKAGKDRRFLMYFIPQQFRPEPGVVDYGFCRLRFVSQS